jgi:xanthine phosphoribosyltransferase
MNAAQVLLQRIRSEGSIEGDIVKVDRFLNHMVDPSLIDLLARDLAERFADHEISKVLTAETSGIMVAMAMATRLRVPFIYAKKKRPITMASCYSATSYSFTKQEATTLYTSRELLTATDRVLFVDDFYAQGSTLAAVEDIIAQSGSELIGTAVLINKSARRDIAAILTLDQIIPAT